GIGLAFAAATSLPHSIVAIPQTRLPPFAVGPSTWPETGRAGKWLSVRYWRACSSRLASPDELNGRQYRTTPCESTAIRNCAFCGGSAPTARKFVGTNFGCPRELSSRENVTSVATTPIGVARARSATGTGPTG